MRSGAGGEQIGIDHLFLDRVSQMRRERCPKCRRYVVELPECRGVSRVKGAVNSRCCWSKHCGIAGEVLAAKAEVEVLHIRQQDSCFDEEDERVSLAGWMNEEHLLVVRPLPFLLGYLHLSRESKRQRI